MTLKTRSPKAKVPKLCYRAFEFAAEPSGDGSTLEGYAAVFDMPTMIDSWEGTFEEVLKRGAFAKTISDRTPVLQFDHGRDARTGSVPIGAIQDLREDDTGLFVRAGLFDNDVVLPIRQAIAGGAIDGMSFRFRVLRENWFDNTGKPINASELSNLLYNPGTRGPLRREILEVECGELGPVVFPAYEATSVSVRSFLAGLDPADRETLMRELFTQGLAIPTMAAFAAALTEMRAGKMLSADTMNTLQAVLDLIAAADDAVDEAQVELSGLMGVANPDDEADPDAAQEGTSGDGTDAGRTATSGLDAAARMRALQLINLRRSA